MPESFPRLVIQEVDRGLAAVSRDLGQIRRTVRLDIAVAADEIAKRTGSPLPPDFLDTFLKKHGEQLEHQKRAALLRARGTLLDMRRAVIDVVLDY